MTARMLYTCATPGCEEAGQGFTDEPTFCSICMQDLAGVYDTTGTLKTEEEKRAPSLPSSCYTHSGGVDSVVTTKSGPRRATDRAHGIGTEVQMHAEPNATTPRPSTHKELLAQICECGHNRYWHSKFYPGEPCGSGDSNGDPTTPHSCKCEGFKFATPADEVAARLAAAEAEVGRACGLVGELVDDRAKIGPSQLAGTEDDDLWAAIEDAQSCIGTWAEVHCEANALKANRDA